MQFGAGMQEDWDPSRLKPMGVWKAARQFYIFFYKNNKFLDLIIWFKFLLKTWSYLNTNRATLVLPQCLLSDVPVHPCIKIMFIVIQPAKCQLIYWVQVTKHTLIPNLFNITDQIKAGPSCYRMCTVWRSKGKADDNLLQFTIT